MPPAIIDEFHRRLRTVIEEKKADLRQALCSNMARDFEDYRYRCGYLVALDDVLGNCEDVEAAIYVGTADREEK